jgi:sugar phosphate permease
VIPLNWKPSKIFYGWWVVSGGFLISLLLGGFVILGFTAFFEPIAEEFDWSYAQISLAVSLRGAEVGLLAPLMGLLVDRWGPRRLVFVGTILIGLALIFLSRITSLGMFYGAFFLLAISDSACSPTVTMTAVANWFRKKVGIATGITACGFALGGLLIPIIVKLIDIFDWRKAIFILGLSMWVIGSPLSLLFRHKPEQYGYVPDGEESNAVIYDQGSSPAQTYEVDIRAKQALKTRAFWHIGLASALQLLAISAVLVHVMPYLSNAGIIRSTSALVAMAMPLTSIIGRLGSGWLGDRFNKTQVAAGLFALMSMGLVCFNYVANEGAWLLFLFVILFGIGWGSTILRTALVREYFGRKRFGTILGFMMGITGLGIILGPLFAGWVFDNWGSYHAAWLVLACLALIGTVIMATTPSVNATVQSFDNK